MAGYMGKQAGALQQGQAASAFTACPHPRHSQALEREVSVTGETCSHVPAAPVISECNPMQL